ncbi:hypothetical protein L9F63_014440 [Diploptera punctata]|uniref:Uncharacterized protein n=1 Tax=Diploptera punctata TaxID=6984 RepID=A0AAD8A7Y7_DIPPU|nr:hypothetical protein L9F63_014440 [Diploptera punctata]
MPLAVTSSSNDQEKHLKDIYAVLYHKDKVYSAAEDGKIKIWSPDLKLEKEFQAHESVVYHIAASDDTLYSCSNDGTIKAWSLDTLKHKKTLLQYNDEVARLYFIEGKLYSGDDKGILTIWEDDTLSRQFGLVEEIRDFKVFQNFVYAVRDRDMCIHELIGGNKGRYVTRISLEGCSPIALVGNKLCFANRAACDICVHDNNKTSGFKQLGIIKAHEMIVNALCGCGDSTLISAGYDGKVKQWNLNDLQLMNSCNIGACINGLCVGSQGQIYAGGNNGFLHRLDNK